MLITNDTALKNAKHCFKLAWERCTKLNCIPKYVKCQAQRTKILGIYLTCQLKNMAEYTKRGRRKKFEVDHIIPLTNKLVCGLHTPENLNIITQHANGVKGNTFTCYREKNGVITLFKEFTSGIKYENRVEVSGRGKKKPKTSQKLAKKSAKNGVKRVLTSKKRLKIVKNQLKTVKNGRNYTSKRQK